MASALSVLESSRRSFVANVSHELKTPMTTIGGFIDGILDGTIPKENHDEYLLRVSEEVKRLSRLVTSMLNLSKIEAGELELKMSEFDITSLVIDSMLSFEQEIEKKSISVEGFENLNPTTVKADRDMLHQVIYNLVDNAVKFTQNEGVISISSGVTQKEEIFVSIRNTGEGVSTEELGKIFERFYKVDKSRSYDVKSAGLGLYLCKTIIEMHGGKIFAESVEGEYTQFTILLSNKK
jgi:signal transduction histidine kinase